MRTTPSTGRQQDSDLEFQMVKPQPGWRVVERGRADQPTHFQLSVAELLFCMTLVCLLLGLYAAVSPTLVYLIGGCVVYIGVMRNLRVMNPVWGGLIGFATASVILFVIAAAVEFDSFMAAISITGTGLGYIIGSAMAGFEDAA